MGHANLPPPLENYFLTKLTKGKVLMHYSYLICRCEGWDMVDNNGWTLTGLISWHSEHTSLFYITPLGKTLTLCQRQYQEYWKYPAMGRYVPRCKPDGSFDNGQCHGPYCFCADQNGNRRAGNIILQSVASIVTSVDCPESGKRDKNVNSQCIT